MKKGILFVIVIFLMAFGANKIGTIGADACVSVLDLSLPPISNLPAATTPLAPLEPPIDKEAIGIVKFIEEEKMHRKRLAGRSWYDWAGTPGEPKEAPMTAAEAAFIAEQRRRLNEEMRSVVKKRP